MTRQPLLGSSHHHIRNSETRAPSWGLCPYPSKNILTSRERKKNSQDHLWPRAYLRVGWRLYPKGRSWWWHQKRKGTIENFFKIYTTELRGPLSPLESGPLTFPAMFCFALLSKLLLKLPMSLGLIVSLKKTRTEENSGMVAQAAIWVLRSLRHRVVVSLRPGWTIQWVLCHSDI